MLSEKSNFIQIFNFDDWEGRVAFGIMNVPSEKGEKGKKINKKPHKQINASIVIMYEDISILRGQKR